jgi:hypothetical protein
VCLHQMALLLGVICVRFGGHFDGLLLENTQKCKQRPGLLGARGMCWRFAGKTSGAEGQTTVLIEVLMC